MSNIPTTPPPATSEPTHAAPSSPNSPLAKRPKPNSAPSDPQPNRPSEGQHSKGTMVGEDQKPVTKVDEAPPLLIKKLSQKAKVPTRGSDFAAG
ncbi:MAG: hypothetical protein M1835_007732, partial [Candelina submexicana]